jgi:hypothetical protein
MYGQIVRDEITDQLHSEIIDMIYTIRPILMEDEEFLRVLERAAKCIEQEKRSYPKANSSSHKSFSNAQSKNKIKENKEKHEKRDKNYINNENNKIQKKDHKKNRQLKFGRIKDALKGIDIELIATNTEAKANCWRCGRDGYYTLESYVKKTKEGGDLTNWNVLGTWNSQRNDDEESSRIEKIPKVDAMGTKIQEKKRICENELEAEGF